MLINQAVEQKIKSMSGEVIKESPYSLLRFQELQNNFKMLIDLISDQVGVAMPVENIAYIIADAYLNKEGAFDGRFSAHAKCYAIDSQ